MAAELLEPLVSAGLMAMVREDGKLVVRPRVRITPNLDAYIRGHRDELIAAWAAEPDAARIDDAIRACWLRIDDFWPLGLGVADQKLVDLEECLHVAACEVEYAVAVRVLAAYEARARELAANHAATVAPPHARARETTTEHGAV
ncbi:MAG: hypothetical protein ACYDC4_04620 [Candidatus Dormibacteria bacterium]